MRCATRMRVAKFTRFFCYYTLYDRTNTLARKQHMYSVHTYTQRRRMIYLNMLRECSRAHIAISPFQLYSTLLLLLLPPMPRLLLLLPSACMSACIKGHPFHRRTRRKVFGCTRANFNANIFVAAPAVIRRKWFMLSSMRVQVCANFVCTQKSRRRRVSASRRA